MPDFDSLTMLSRHIHYLIGSVLKGNDHNGLLYKTASNMWMLHLWAIKMTGLMGREGRSLMLLMLQVRVYKDFINSFVLTVNK